MNPWTHKPKLKPGRFRVGERVRLLIPWAGLHEGDISEDRGNIGAGGRRLYHVRIQVDQWNEMTIPYGEEELAAIDG